MRILFSIIAVLGVLLTGLSVFEIRAMSDYRTRVEDVQLRLSYESEKEVAKITQKGGVFTGQTVNGYCCRKLQGIDALERGWFAAASVSVMIFFAGVAGIIAGRRHDIPTIKAPEPN